VKLPLTLPEKEKNGRMEGFGERLRDAMLAAGIETPGELAKKCGVSRQTAQSWLAMREPLLRGTYLLKVADCLKVRMRWLSTGRGPVPISPELDELTTIAAHLSPESLAEWKEIGRKMAE
jgi:transcriptional regulator with XRE-family HTH domain